MNRIEAKSSTKIPSQPIQNPNVSAIVTRSGKELEIIVKDKGKGVKKTQGYEVESRGKNDDNIGNGDESNPV